MEEQKNRLYDPSPRQELFHESTCLYRLFGWAAWWWKSKAIRMEAVTQLMSNVNIRGLIVRRTHKELQTNIIDKFMAEIPWLRNWKGDFKINLQTQRLIHKPTNSELLFWYCRYEKDVYQYQSDEFDFICVDELTQFTEFQYKYLLSRLRSTKKDVVPNFFWATNPWNIGHWWVKRLWVDRNEYFKWEKPREYEFIKSFVYDNKYIIDNDPEYIERLEALPEKERKALLYWDWDIFDWQFFKEFNRDLHVTRPHIPSWKKIIALDYWYTNPSAVYWMNKDNFGKITVYRELYVTEHTYKQLAVKIRALTWEDEKINCVIVDPAIFAKSWNVENGVSWWDILWENLPRKIERANNDRINWASLYRVALQPYRDLNTWEICATLEICSNCVNLIRTMPQLIHDKNRVEDVDTDWEDHSYDATRYWLMYLWVDRKSFKEIKDINMELMKTKSKVNNNFWKPKNKLENSEKGNILIEKF